MFVYISDMGIILLAVCMGSNALIDFVDTGLPEPVILTREEKQVAVVRQASNQCRRHLFIVQNVYPAGELEVRAEDKDLLCFRLRNVVEQQLRPGPVIRDKPKLIQDEDAVFLQSAP